MVAAAETDTLIGLDNRRITVYNIAIMPVKSVTMAFRVSPEMKRALELAAERERRTVSAWIELTLERALVERGLMTRPNPDNSSNKWWSR